MQCEEDSSVQGFSQEQQQVKKSGFFENLSINQTPIQNQNHIFGDIEQNQNIDQNQVDGPYNVQEPTLANGDCLFASFLQAIGINQEHALQLRQVIHDALSNNVDLIHNFFQQDNYLQSISVNTYLSLIRQQGFWGGYPELQILSLLSGININIVTVNGNMTTISREGQAINNLIPEITLLYNQDHYTPIGNYSGNQEEVNPNDSITFQRILANRANNFEVELLGFNQNLITEQQLQDQLSLVQDQAFIDYIKGQVSGNLDRVLYLISTVGGSNLEEFLFNKRRQEEELQEENFDFTPILFQEDFMFKENNIYKFPHCQENDEFGQIQGSNILNEAYSYLKHLALSGVRIYPDAWNKGNNAKQRSKNRNKKLKKVEKYYVQQCGKENCQILALYQKDVAKGKEKKNCRILSLNQQQEMLTLVHKNHEKANQMANHIWNMGAHWYGMEKDCKSYVEQCVVCAQQYTKQLKRSPGEFQDPKAPNYRLVIDCVEISHNIAKLYINNLNKNSKVQILTIIDAFSKKSNAFHLPDKKGATIRKFLDQHFTSGIQPRQVLSDNGTEFVNQEVNQLMNELGIEFIHGRPYHPQTQGVIERFNQTLQQNLYRRASQDELNQGSNLNFQSVINQVVQSYNNRIHKSHGLTPNNAYLIADEQQQKEIIEKMRQRFPKQNINYNLKKGDKILVLDDVYQAQNRRNLLVRKTQRGKGKRTTQKAKYSLIATVTEDCQFNVKAKFEPGQQFDPNTYYIIPTEFIKKVNQELIDKMLKKEKKDQSKMNTIQEQEEILPVQQRLLKPCIICYETDSLQYTQCCNQPIHLQCHLNGLNHSQTCPYCRTQNYKIQNMCLVPDRKYLSELDESSDDNIDSNDSLDDKQTKNPSQIQPLAEIKEELQEQEDLNFPDQLDQDSEEYDYGDNEYNMGSSSESYNQGQD